MRQACPSRITNVDTDSPMPPYEQSRTQISRLVASGQLVAGDPSLPSATRCGPQYRQRTVARGYRELETKRLIRTRARGTFVAEVRKHDAKLLVADWAGLLREAALPTSLS